MRRLANGVVVWLIAPAGRSQLGGVYVSAGRVRGWVTFRDRGDMWRAMIFLALLRFRVVRWAFDGLCRVAGRTTFTEMKRRRQVDGHKGRVSSDGECEGGRL